MHDDSLSRRRSRAAIRSSSHGSHRLAGSCQSSRVGTRPAGALLPSARLTASAFGAALSGVIANGLGFDYNHRLTAMRLSTATPDEAYWRVRRQVILRHTGEVPLEVRGPDAERMLDRVFTRDVSLQASPVSVAVLAKADRSNVYMVGQAEAEPLMFRTESEPLPRWRACRSWL